MSLAEFRAQGRLGCARCYTTFQSALGPLLRKLHGAARHVGRTPRTDGRITELRRRVETLRAEIERAVRSEEYERAAALRDELRAVEDEQSVLARGGPETAPGTGGAS
jgi:protein arginine kinase activator